MSVFVHAPQWASYVVGGITHLNCLILLSSKLQRKISKVSASDHWSCFLLVQKSIVITDKVSQSWKKNHVIYIDSYTFKFCD